ncbi:hypothetical protein O3P69_011624 [Scylla paramamosain]|uniref:Uncharacterized protein n=1 Tax=Scylla paramamosain TaxID=85552 RepID=A0AAW0T6K7_SCYPA
MFSLLNKRENAHSEGIWACAWGHFVPEDKSKEKSSEEKDENKENEDTQNEEDKNVPDIEQKYVVTGGLDDLVRVWQWGGEGDDELALLHTLEGHSLGVISVDVNPSGTIAASSSLDSTIRLWNLHTGEQLQSIDCGPVEAWSVGFSPEGNHIASGNYAGKINIYATEGGHHVTTLDTRGRFTYSIAYSRDGKYVASGAIDGIHQCV